jgi:TPR repeat protein
VKTIALNEAQSCLDELFEDAQAGYYQKRKQFESDQDGAELSAPPPEDATSEAGIPPTSAPSAEEDTGSRESQRGLGRADDPGVAPEVTELQRVTELAEQGDAYSAYCLGVYYRDGLKVPKDLVKAREWLQKAASQGIGGAKIELHALLMRWNIEVGKMSDHPN